MKKTVLYFFSCIGTKMRNSNKELVRIFNAGARENNDSTKRILISFFSLFFFLFCGLAFTAQLKSLDILEQEQKTVLSFNLSGSFSYKAFTLKHPDRLVVDFFATQSAARPQPLAKGQHPAIKNIRQGSPNAQVLRVVFDLNYPVKISTNKTTKQLEISWHNPTSSKISQKKAANTPIMVSQSPSKSLRDVVVVIDPGHGGKDPGAIGPSRHLEKNVVLAIALKLKKIIDNESGMRAILTRKGDYYVGLRQRLDLARKHDGDIFISIHADAFKKRTSNGASVFALSQTGATSEAARWLAEKENYSELGGVNLSELDDQNGVIRSVLIDLSQTATIGASLKVGERVLNSLDGMTRLHNKEVEQARFVVLKSPDIPSILVETGFISNPREERNLASSAYQHSLAKAIFKGVQQYFFAHPPHGSFIEVQATTRKHLVKRGETLGGIAARYHTSVFRLKELNRLSSDELLVGQRLVVPKRWS